MPRFEDSQWADRSFSQAYRDDSDRYLPFRHLVMGITRSFFQHFSSPNKVRRVLDLGCGDGLFMQGLLEAGPELRAVLVDGSQEMLDAARARLHRYAHLRLVRASFQDLLAPMNRYKGNPDNVPDSLASQMQALENIGFQQVDCYFKYGIFSLFGGKRT